MDTFYHVYQLPLWSVSIEHTTPDCACTGKQCTRCTYTLCLGNFHRHSRSKGGFRAACKFCRKAESETEEFKANRRERHKENAEHINEMKRAWCHANPDKSRAHHKASRNRHLDRYKAREQQHNHSEKGRARDRRYSERYPERRRASKAAWRERNPERHKLHAQVRSANRKTRKLQSEGSFTTKEWEALKSEYNHTCLKCGKKEPEIKLSADHVIPLAKRGSNYISNIQPLCTRCNSSKGAKIIDYRPHWKNEGLSG